MAKKAKASSLRKPGTNPNKVKPSETVPKKTSGRFKNTKPKAKPKAKPKESVKDSVKRALNTSNAASKGRKMGGGKAGAIIAGLGVLGGMAASYFSGKSDKSQVGDKSKSNPSSAWSSVNERPKTPNYKSIAGISDKMAPKETLTKKPTMSPKETMTKVTARAGRGGAMSSSDIESMRKGKAANATTPAKTEAAKQSISLGQMALNNADDKNTYGKRTYPDNVAINRNPDMGGAKSSKKSGFTPRSKPTPPSRSRKTSVDTESYSGASRPNPGFEFNDNVAPKPLNKAGGTKNTPDGFSQFMANLTGVDVTPDNDKGKKKFATAKNKTGGAFFGMFK